MRAIAAGFQHHISKPVELAELATFIASLTGRLAAMPLGRWAAGPLGRWAAIFPYNFI